MGLTITFQVDEPEHHDLMVRAEREKVSLSDYIRVRLGLRGQGSQSDDILVDPAGPTPEERLDDHDRRLGALEEAASMAAAGHGA